MGVGPFKNCSTNYTPNAPAPNPNPERWEILQLWQGAHAHVLRVRYLDCTNFEGIKIMVFRGQFNAFRRHLDPHFSEIPNSPIARFRPDENGWHLAKQFTMLLMENKT